jgi:hypothetical protein
MVFYINVTSEQHITQIILKYEEYKVQKHLPSYRQVTGYALEKNLAAAEKFNVDD